MSDVDLLGQVIVSDGLARVRTNGQVREYRIKELPESFIRWQLDYKQRVYNAIEHDQYVAFNAGHLPLEIFEGSTYRSLSQNPMVQTMFPYSYTLWVYDWKEKTPKRRYK